MKLYHFTPAQNLMPIWNSKTINPSVMALAPGQMGSAVSLTDSSDSSGHGLTEGRPFKGIPPSSLATTYVGGQYITKDAREIRITLNIDLADPKLEKASELYGDNSRMMIGLEIAAAYPHQVEPSEDELGAAVAALKSNTLLRMGSTWWYYFGQISTSLVVDVEKRQANGVYQTIFHTLP